MRERTVGSGYNIKYLLINVGVVHNSISLTHTQSIGN